MNGSRVSFSWLSRMNNDLAIELFDGFEDSFLKNKSPVFGKGLFWINENL